MKRLLLFVLLLALIGGGYYYYTSLKKGPEYALLQAAAATQTHDVAAFERYVDVDALTGHLVDDVANHSGVLSALVPGGGLALRGGLQLLKPQLATGSIEAAQEAAPKHLVNLSFLGLVGRVVSPDSKFKGVKYSTDKGNEALVGLEFTQPRYDTTMVVEVKLLKQADGHWQAKEITNTTDLLQGVARLEKTRLLK
jgi:hypothetical protein